MQRVPIVWYFAPSRGSTVSVPRPAIATRDGAAEALPRSPPTRHRPRRRRRPRRRPRRRCRARRRQRRRLRVVLGGGATGVALVIIGVLGQARTPRASATRSGCVRSPRTSAARRVAQRARGPRAPCAATSPSRGAPLASPLASPGSGASSGTRMVRATHVHGLVLVREQAARPWSGRGPSYRESRRRSRSPPRTAAVASSPRAAAPRGDRACGGASAAWSGAPHACTSCRCRSGRSTAASPRRPRARDSRRDRVVADGRADAAGAARGGLAGVRCVIVSRCRARQLTVVASRPRARVRRVDARPPPAAASSSVVGRRTHTRKRGVAAVGRVRHRRRPARTGATARSRAALTSTPCVPPARESPTCASRCGSPPAREHARAPRPADRAAHERLDGVEVGDRALRAVLARRLAVRDMWRASTLVFAHLASCRARSGARGASSPSVHVCHVCPSISTSLSLLTTASAREKPSPAAPRRRGRRSTLGILQY